jgi:hypothetical protein
MDKLREILRSLYIRACVDFVQNEKDGEGKELCEERIKVAHQDIIALVPEEKEIIKEIDLIRKEPNIYNLGWNACRQEMLKRLGG